MVCKGGYGERFNCLWIWLGIRHRHYPRWRALGAVQCAAWDLDFPTTFELYLWRYSSVVTAAILPVMAVVIFSMSFFRVAAPRVRKYVSMATWVTYILGRLAIIIETVRTIFFLPPGAFVSTWSSTIPHIAWNSDLISWPHRKFKIMYVRIFQKRSMGSGTLSEYLGSACFRDLA